MSAALAAVLTALSSGPGASRAAAAVGASATATTAPLTTAFLSPASVNDEYQDPTTITLSADDGDGPGVAATYYRIDGGVYQTYTGPFDVGATGDHTVNYYSVDDGGDAEALETTTFLIAAPPVTTAQPTPAPVDGYYNEDPTVTLTAGDGNGPGVAATYYQLDGGGYRLSAAPVQITGDGQHTLQYYSTDAYGTAETPNTFTLNVDTTPPVTVAQLTATPANGPYPAHTTVTLLATDGFSGVAGTYCALDGGAFQTCARPFQITGDGTHLLRYYSVDEAGNVEATQSLTVEGATPSASASVAVTAPPVTTASLSAPAADSDATAPLTIATLAPGPTDGYYLQSPTVTLSASDAGSGVAQTYYEVDDQGYDLYTAPFQISGEGSHTLRYYSTDDAGNAEAPHQLTVVESRPPSVTITAPADDRTLTRGQRVPTRFSCAQASGGAPIESCVDQDARTSPGILDTATVGRRAYTVTATGADGQTATATIHYSVIAIPPPVLGRSADVTPVRGVVLVKLPPGPPLAGSHSARSGGAPRATVSAAHGFVTLAQAGQIPVNSILDTTHGTVAITTATTHPGQLNSGQFTGGRFRLLQSPSQNGLTDLDLMDVRNRQKVCRPVAGQVRAFVAKKLGKTVLAQLKSSDHGNISVRGNYSATAPLGTVYSVRDTCAGTLTTVTDGVVVVDYFHRHRRVVVKTGHSFLAKASGAPSSPTTVHVPTGSGQTGA